MTWFQLDNPSWSVTGIDVAPEGLAVARSAGLSVEQASVLEMPFDDRSFDTAVSTLVFCTVPDAGRATVERMRDL